MLLARFLGAVIDQGEFTLIDSLGRAYNFGDGAAPRVAIRLHDKATERRLLLNPRLAAGEAYMEGKLKIEEGTLYDLIDLIGRNIEAFEHHWFSDFSANLSQVFRRIQQ